MGRLRQLIFEYDRIKQEPQYQLNLLNGLPNVPTCPRALRSLRADLPKYVLLTGNLKISVLI